MVTMKYDRYRLTGVIFILSCCFFPLRAGTFQTVFADGAAGWTVSGESSALVRKNGGTRFDSAAAVSEAYRYLTLTSPEIMDGDFSVAFTFRITRFDHWNSMRISVGSVRGSNWSAALYRANEKQGQELFRCVTATGGTLEQAVERAYAAADRVHFQNAYCRRDIGQKALQQKGRS